MIGGGVIAAGELLLGPAREAMARRALRRRGTCARGRGRPFGADAGMIGAALLAADPDAAEWGPDGRHLAWPERPPRRLPDADRQPRGRDAARARGAARGRPGRLRGHAPHARAARPLRGAGVARLLPRAQRARADARARRPHARRRGRRARLRRRACRWSPTPATCSWRAASPRGSRSRCCPGPSAAIAALVASGLPARALALRRLPAAQARRARGALGAAETLVAFESPRRVGASLAVLAGLDPARPVAVCRELTKTHEEVVRGGATTLAARYADARPLGEVVLVLGRAPPRGRGPDPPAIDAVRRLARRRRPRAPGRDRRGRAHRRSRQRSVPRCDKRRTGP